MHSAQCSETKKCPCGRGKKCPKPSGQSFTPSKGLPWEQWGPFISFLVPLPPKMLSFSEDYQRIFSTWYFPKVWKSKEGIFFFLNSCESISLTYRFSLVDKQHQPVFIFNLRLKYKFNSANLWGTDQLTHWSDPEPYLDIIDNRRDKAAD